MRLSTMAAMERHEGHFYNWYDTQSLKPLPPLYVSAVDSGNLAGHLMTLRPGLAALADDRIMSLRWFEGLSDTLRALTDAVGGIAPASFVRLQRDLETAYDSRPTTLAAARQWLDQLGADVAAVAAQFSGGAGTDSASTPAPLGESTFWANALVQQCGIMRKELALLAPWSALPAAPSGFGDLPGILEIPTLRELAALEGELLPAIERRRPGTRRRRNVPG